MHPFRITGIRAALGAMQWRRGLRAGLAVGASLVACQLLGHPGGWVALGSLQVITVDNGGPYRSRFANISAVMVGSTAGVLLGTLAGGGHVRSLLLTAGFCFAVTFLRVLAQPFAATSVVSLVTYVVAFGSAQHTWPAAQASAQDFLLGALWAALLSLALWPVDPFRPARNAVADVFDTLQQVAAALPALHQAEEQTHFHERIARFRAQIEHAHAMLASTRARTPSRTIRARHLTALVEDADLLLARFLQLAEHAGRSPEHAESLQAATGWLLAALAPLDPALRHRPASGAAAFAPEGSLSLELRRSADQLLPNSDPTLTAALRDCLLGLEIAYEGVRAIWTGAEPRRTGAAGARGLLLPDTARLPAPWQSSLDSLRAHWTLGSVALRHTLRLTAVLTLDVALLRSLHVTHSYWLPMTSVIVLQPYTGETVRRSGQRALGTVCGALIAAVLAAALPAGWAILCCVSVGALFALAVYAVDYAWYCFFLTPTIVLLALPHPGDWHFAAIRMGFTLLGATVALLATLLVFPERESLQLPGLLSRALAAEAAYLRAMLTYWSMTEGAAQPATRLLAERTVLAPARRRCGLLTTDAEETLDRALLEHAIPLNPARTRTGKLNRAALTLTTYLRRATQTVTATAAQPQHTTEQRALVNHLLERLDRASQALQQPRPAQPSREPAALPDSEPWSRLARQVGVLERAAAELVAATQV